MEIQFAFIIFGEDAFGNEDKEEAQPFSILSPIFMLTLYLDILDYIKKVAHYD